MKKHVGILAILLFGSYIITSCSQKEAYDLAIKNVKLYDSHSKMVFENKTILINADTIAAIIDLSEEFKANEVIQGQGRLLTPGFIDTHTHLMQNYGSDENIAPETIEPKDFGLVRGLMSHHYLSQGVTTIIDMGQPETWMDVTLNWQNNPEPEYPNLFICGGSIVSDEDRRQPQHHIEVMSPEDGRKKVRDYASKGLKHMKLYRKLRKPDMEAMADEAKKLGITINTHTDNNVVTIDDAMEMDILNFEHFFTVTPSILNYDEHWKAMNEKYGIQMNSSIDEFSAHMTYFFSYIKENPEFETKLEALFDRMAAKGASISTAINVLASSAEQTAFFTSFEYFPIRRKPMVSYSEEQQNQLKSAFEAMMFYVKKAHDKGVKIRIGTDCRFGGKAMLHELISLHKAGFKMEDILQIATINGYEAMKLENNYGSIEVGKKADMILFEKNPFDNYQNILSNKTIIKGGKQFVLKKSIAYDLLDVMVDQGPKKALVWFEKSRLNKAYDPLNANELINVFSELIGTGKIDEGQAVYNLFETNFPKMDLEVDGNLLTNGTYALLRNNEIQKAINFYAFSQSNFPNTQKTLALAALIETLENGIGKGLERYETLKIDSMYLHTENEMNGVGYLLLQLDKTKEAISFFELNAKSFPDSWNVFDSLGEAYATDDQKAMAIKHYKKSIELNPKNEYGKEQLKKLIGGTK